MPSPQRVASELKTMKLNFKSLREAEITKFVPEASDAKSIVRIRLVLEERDAGGGPEKENVVSRIRKMTMKERLQAESIKIVKSQICTSRDYYVPCQVRDDTTASDISCAVVSSP